MNLYLKELYTCDWNIRYYKTNEIIVPIQTTLEKNFFYLNSFDIYFFFNNLVANLICLFRPLQNVLFVFFCCWPDRFLQILLSFTAVSMLAWQLCIYNLDVYPLNSSAKTEFRCEFL